jgi:hypothetical protein
MATLRNALPLLALVRAARSLTVPLPPPLLNGPVTGSRQPLRALMTASEPAGGDQLVTAISADGSISAKAIVTTELVAENSRLQGLGGLAAAALGRAITCTLRG